MAYLETKQLIIPWSKVQVLEGPPSETKAYADVRVSLFLARGAHALKFAKYAERYLGAIAYRFNRRFDLAALPNRLLRAAATLGSKPERVLRLAANSC